LKNTFQLCETFRKKAQLQRKRIALRLFIKLRKEGIVCEFFQHQLGVVLLRQQTRERGFTRANNALYDGVIVQSSFLFNSASNCEAFIFISR